MRELTGGRAAAELGWSEAGRRSTGAGGQWLPGRERTGRMNQSTAPAGAALWIAWPRRAAGHRSDVTENLIREVALPLGLVDTKVAALDADWSGLKIVWRRERR
jgi:hypothetical protein